MRGESLIMRARSIKERFEQVFSHPAEVVARGPGRVDLLGSHTDYNDGFVLPVAIDLEVMAAGRARNDDTIRLWSNNFGELSRFSLKDIAFDTEARWSNYARGVVKFLRERGNGIRGADVLIDGRVPIASGLSSSAAIEMAVATLFEALFNLDVPPVELALIGKRAENEFVGINTGIMDQFASRLGKSGHALFLDCRSLEYELVPLPTEKVKIVVADTMKRRGLVDSEYNRRRSQCEEAARELGRHISGVRALRDVTAEQFEQHRDALPEVIRKRAEHVIYENERVLKSRQMLQAGDLAGFGRLMDASHDSARDLYEVSCVELETMVWAARKVPGVLSARMAGAGFGGCAVSLVPSEAVKEFQRLVAAEYEARIGVKPTFYVCETADGAGTIPVLSAEC
ncbi:MAG: galactokinase [Armatimonadota bacterium]|nr:galactokinase [Armatimonadota bacterium]